MAKITLHQWNNHSIAQTEEAMQIAGLTVPKGYVNASQMCLVKHKKWHEYLQTEATQVYIQSLAEHLEISTAELIVTLRQRSAGILRGSWVHPEIALHLAQWLGIKFWDWFTLAAQEVTPEQPPKTLFALLKALARSEYFLTRTEERLIEKEEQLQAEQPMIDYYNRAMNSDDSFPMEEVAKILGYSQLGRNNLFLFLRHMGLLTLNNLPYQKYIDAGYFKCAAVPCPKRKGRTQTFVTQKGMDYIHRLIQENDYRRCLHEWGYFQSSLEDELEDDLDAA